LFCALCTFFGFFFSHIPTDRKFNGHGSKLIYQHGPS
jgi:hypothetical protein